MRPSIAIVDSDATTRRTLLSLLGPLGVEMQVFDSAESYLAQAKTEKIPTCLIVDVTLSGMTGLQLLKQIRAANVDLPVILLAPESDVSIAVDAMRHGATDFIEKPQMDVALLRRVSQLVRNGNDLDVQTKAAHR
jgi:two-component system, LuxR family, response regulator FixJ